MAGESFGGSSFGVGAVAAADDAGAAVAGAASCAWAAKQHERLAIMATLTTMTAVMYRIGVAEARQDVPARNAS